MRKYTEDEKFMKEAIKQAKKAEAIGDVPIGCVIVHDGKIIAGSILNLLEMQEFNHQAEVERGVLQEECSEMLSAFFRKLREIQKEKKKKRKLIQEENQTDN